MTEEINENNCVLDDGELKIIDHALEDYFNVCTNSDYKYDKLLKKINKLNDLVKYMQKRGILIYDGEKAHRIAKEKSK